MHKLSSIYRFIESFDAFRILPEIYKKKCSAKIIIAWNYLSKASQYVWQEFKYRRTFEYSRVLNMSQIMKKRLVLQQAPLIFEIFFLKFSNNTLL